MVLSSLVTTARVLLALLTIPLRSRLSMQLEVLALRHRRRVVHFGVTENPTAQWMAQQLVNTFPWVEAPRYLLRDRDGVYG